MKPKKNSKPTQKRTTWTFQPDPDVEEMVTEYLNSHPEITKTDLLNSAVKGKFPEVCLDIAERELSKISEHVEELRRISASKRSK